MAEAPMTETPFSAWTVFWLIWGAAMLLDIAAALVRKQRTFSEHIWGRWFSEPWKRVVFLVFWATVGVHFAMAGRNWFASGWAVLVTAAPVAGLILWRERSMFGKVWNGLKKVGGWLLTSKNWVLTHGPIVSSIVMAIGSVWPGASPVANVVGGLISGAGGGAADSETVKVLTDVAVRLFGLISAIGVARKTLGPQLANPQPAK